MMYKMNAKHVKQMMLAVCQAEIDNKEELCRLDSFVGDGDHGYTVERGFSAVKNILQTTDFETPGEIFKAVGDTLAEAMGGAIGLIIGGLYTGGAQSMLHKAEIDKDDCGVFLEDGLSEIKMIGGAKEGDKTLLDTLSPAATAYRDALQAGGDLKACMAAAAKAGRAGSDATFDMAAKKGRAKFLQEKSRGYVDAGSVTMAIILEAMAAYCQSDL